jgi:hypothetical protein
LGRRHRDEGAEAIAGDGQLRAARASYYLTILCSTGLA